MQIFLVPPSCSGLDIFQYRLLRMMRIVRVRLRIATAEEELTSWAVHWASLMVQTSPVADQALRKRNIRQENIILTCRQRRYTPRCSAVHCLPGSIGWCRRRRG